MIKNEEVKNKLNINSKEIYVYKTILDVYETIINNYLLNITSEEEKSKLIMYIKKGIATIKNANDFSFKENYIRRLEGYLKCIDNKEVKKSVNIKEIKENYFYNLLNILSSKKDLLIAPGMVINENNLDSIIGLIDDKELMNEVSKYIQLELDVKDVKDYIHTRSNALKMLQKLAENMPLVDKYKLILKHYFEYKIENKYVLDIKKEKIAEYHAYEESALDKLLYRSRIETLKEIIANLNTYINNTNAKILNKKIELENFIANITDNELYYIFDFNKDIILTLDRLSNSINPFFDKNLDVSFEGAMSSLRKSDILYFISSNIYDITEENLSEILNYLSIMIDKYTSALNVKERYLEKYQNEMSDDAKLVVSNNHDIALLATNLTSKESINGIRPIAYLYTLDLINNLDINKDNIKEFIDLSVDEKTKEFTDSKVLIKK